jgi:hypothetical protein
LKKIDITDRAAMRAALKQMPALIALDIAALCIKLPAAIPSSFGLRIPVDLAFLGALHFRVDMA